MPRIQLRQFFVRSHFGKPIEEPQPLDLNETPRRIVKMSNRPSIISNGERIRIGFKRAIELASSTNRSLPRKGAIQIPASQTVLLVDYDSGRRQYSLHGPSMEVHQFATGHAQKLAA